ncbi:MAG: peptidyl-prolyl cis-trans isomerase [Candidatus Hydrogenedentes bacterium]|nr:peptidyl-prolyl cis-trans isomerase [Candidatus Hydrogenedentota bacterium]
MRTINVLAATSLLAFAGLAARADIVDQVVATVDKEAILMSDLMAEIGPQLRDLRAQATSQADLDQLLARKMRDTLDQAIENRILLREGQLAGVVIDDATVDQRFEEFKRLYPSNDEFMADIEKSGQTVTDIKERLKKQMIARTMAARKTTELEKGITITESEIAQFYQDNKNSFQHAERARCSQIFLPAGNDLAERDKVRAQMEQLKDEIANGADFAELAIEHSKAPGAEDGGIIGWVQRGDLVGRLDEAAFALGEGEVSGVIETDQGFHLVKVEKKEAAGQATLDDVRKDIEPQLRSAAAAEKFKKWMEDLRKRSSVQVFI